MYKKETIVAISTAPIISAVGIVRLSGEEAVEIVEKIFSKVLKDKKSHTLTHGEILDECGNIIDDVLVSVFKKPNSYTGENIVEISCHGSPFVLKRVVELCLKNGARNARNGEFTKRAFINGKMDLAQSESVIDLIEAESQKESQVALNALKGNLSKSMEKVRNDLLDITAQILAYIDYPDDEIADVSPEVLKKSIEDAYNRVTVLKKSYKQGQIIKNGIKTVICGKPNVGKSSLMNKLLGYERSIVTDIAGTTRDTVEEKCLFGGEKLLLCDTAGMHNSTDVVEKFGVQRAKTKITEADLIFYLYDLSSDFTQEDAEITEQLRTLDAIKIAVLNKRDITDECDMNKFLIFDEVIKISVKDDIGFDELEARVKSQFEKINLKTTAVIMNLRQYECVVRAEESLKNAILNINLTPDAVLVDIEDAVKSLGEVFGKTINEEVVENIFSRFCVGK